MEFISDVLLAAGALGAGFYCLVLSRRLRKFMQLEKGVGGAIASLSTQVDEMSRAVAEARRLASDSTRSLTELTARAGEAERRLGQLLATAEDLPAASFAPGRARDPIVEKPVDTTEPEELAAGAQTSGRLRLIRRLKQDRRSGPSLLSRRCCLPPGRSGWGTVQGAPGQKARPSQPKLHKRRTRLPRTATPMRFCRLSESGKRGWRSGKRS